MTVQEPAPHSELADDDHLLALLGTVSEALARRINEAPLTAEQCEEITRRAT